MRQILVTSGRAVVARVPAPAVRPGSVVIRVHYSFVSVGTEVAALRSTAFLSGGRFSVADAGEHARTARRYLEAAVKDPRRAARRLGRITRALLAEAIPAPAGRVASSPAVAPDADEAQMPHQASAIGYSVAGEVVEVGEGVTDLVPGDLVAAGGAGQANHAEYVCVGRNLVCRIPPGCAVQWAASATVGAIALQGVRRARPELGDTVVVLGLGLIGQLTSQLLRANGCRTLGLDLDESRVARARSLGMPAGAADADEFRRLVRDATAGRGADKTLITGAAKSDALVNLAMELTRAKGTVVVVGDVGLHVQRETFYRKEIDLLVSTSYGPGRYDRAYEEEGRDYPFPYVRWTLNRNMEAYLDLLAAGRIEVAPLVDKVVRADEAPAVYEELVKGGRPAPLGVVIAYDLAGAPASDERRLSFRAPRAVPAPGPIRYALVGVGGFGAGVLVPHLQKMKERFSLGGVVSRDAVRGGNFAREHEAPVVATDLDTVLGDPAFDLVIIATRHHEHADQVARSLTAGKAVFVEKPLALSWQELERVVAARRGAASAPLLMVGFNRRFSPALQALVGALDGRRSPLVIQYRVNAGYIPPDHWVQDSRGGGRNLGEACHMYDVFRFLAKGAVTGVSAAAVDAGRLPYRRNENFCATVQYGDGSVASLVYTALGPREGLPKERVEVFCDEQAYVIDDYRSLTRGRDGAVLWQANEADKGHSEELRRLGEALAAGGPTPIPFEEIVETTAVALTIEDLLHPRGDETD